MLRQSQQLKIISTYAFALAYQKNGRVRVGYITVPLSPKNPA